MKAIFLDRDGTLNIEPPDEAVVSPDDVVLNDNVIEGLKIISQLGYKVFILTNQPGIARKRISEEQFWAVNDKLLELIAPSGIKISKTYVCPHEPVDNCDCRKPKAGLVKQVLSENLDIDISESWVIGARLRDVGLAQAIGSHMVLINADGKYTEDTAEFVASDFQAAAQIIQQEAGQTNTSPLF